MTIPRIAILAARGLFHIAWRTLEDYRDFSRDRTVFRR